ncbi:MAG: hypothetical protein CSA19_00500 [Deltaproteobacteria bacterium]|nr:MAG: hypothetical protein CSA19_00500 [Deltaproteobacteria bacterium]
MVAIDNLATSDYAQINIKIKSQNMLLSHALGNACWSYDETLRFHKWELSKPEACAQKHKGQEGM